MFRQIESWLLGMLSSGTAEAPRPAFDKNNQSNIPGLYIIGDLAGAPVIKLAMEQGFNVIQHLASLPPIETPNPDTLDVIIIGAGASGLNAALQARERGLSYVVLEKEQIASTIQNFPEGKWVYAEPDSTPPKGKLWLDGATKEDLLARWQQIVDDNDLNVRTGDGADTIEKDGDLFTVKTDSGITHLGKRVVLAMGQRGNPRKLGVTGEDREAVYHRLYSPKHYRDENILVVGGGNSAIEAAIVLAEQNHVTLTYRGSELSRIFKDNERKLNDAVSAGRIKLLLNSHVTLFGDGEVTLELQDGEVSRQETVPYQHAFVLIGAELPVKFLKKQGIRLEGEWTGRLWPSLGLTLLTLIGLAIWGNDQSAWSQNLFGRLPSGLGIAAAAAGLGGLLFGGWVKKYRFAWLGVSFLVCYTVYGVKVGGGTEFWPYRGWGYDSFSFFERPWPFWYTVLYSVLMTVFGIAAIRKWGFEKKDRMQIMRYTSLIGFQWIMYFIVPEFLFQAAVKYQWVGEALATDPQFAGAAWRAYGIVYAWPLFFYTWFYDPHQIWVVWGILLSFGILPVFAYFHGKRYCSWICGCGGLAETLGDGWRVLAPKGMTSVKWEKMNVWILLIAVLVTGVMLLKDSVGFISAGAAERGVYLYKILVDVWLVGIIPVTLYPFLGGKIWCRYWCPLAKMMGLYSSRLKGKFKIASNDKCIGCYQCSRHCQVGIPVMQYALKQEDITTTNTSCIGCGICVTVCPMDTLQFGDLPQKSAPTDVQASSP